MAGTELELTKGTKTSLALLEETGFGERGVALQNLAQAKLWARDVAASGMAPKGMDTEGKVLLAVQTGMELGFSPMQALQAVVVVNGRATLMGEAALALIRSSGLLEVGTDIELGCRPTTAEEKEAWGSLVGYCRTRRKGKQWNETFFSENDAKRAKLWTKAGPWTEYPTRQLQWRAVGFHFRDYWSDVGKGVMIDVEARDIRAAGVRDVTPVKLEERGAAPDPLFADAEIIDVRDEPQKVAVVLDDLTGEVVDEIDPETGEVIPPGVGVVFDD